MSCDRDGNRSNPYKPEPHACCEACCFARGEHASWCPVGLALSLAAERVVNAVGPMVVD